MVRVGEPDLHPAEAGLVAQAAAGFRVVAPDQRGYGRSAAPPPWRTCTWRAMRWACWTRSGPGALIAFATDPDRYSPT